MAVENDLYRNMINIYIRVEFEIFKVKVPLICARHGGCLATQG
jgi:hypothetical protein